MKLVFSDNAWQDYLHWQDKDRKTLKRINDLIREVMRTPFSGRGKPEPLKGDLKGWWSRRITLEDRMVYRVTESGTAQSLEIAALRFHYGRAGS